ncbi:MAG: response regulator transcription factor [Rhodocyclaceae bacterium]|nr:response regulator transcription factor [Rhodocyclaceae bacterium]
MQLTSTEQTIGVFLVDDHKCVLWGLEKLVAGEQPRMRVAGKASNRADALAGIRAAAPNIVLLDLDLGGSSSLEFLPELLAQTAAQVLILTGTRDGALLERAVALGARGIVRKDESAEVLIQAIERVHQGELWLERSTLARVLGAFTRGERPDPKAKQTEPLTPKERQIVAAIVDQRGAKGDVIAGDLHMSGHTLRNHLTTIYRKLDVRNRLELVMFALENNLAGDAAAGGRPLH